MKNSHIINLINYILFFAAYRIIVTIIGSVNIFNGQPIAKIALVILSISILMFIQLKIIAAFAEIKLSLKKSALVTLCALALFITIIVISSIIPKDAIMLSALILMLKDLILMLLAASFGYAVSFIIREPNIIIPVALFAAIVDLWGVTSGPVSVVLEKKPEIVDNVAVHMPSPVMNAPATLIGIGDFIFFALFFGIIYRFSLNDKGTFNAAYILLLIAMTAVLIFGIPVPALVPMAIAVIAANYSLIKLSKQEKYSILILLFLVIIMLVLFNRSWLEKLFI